MKQWFEQRSAQERLLLTVMALLLLLLLVYLSLVRPLNTKHQELLADVEQRQAALEWMQGAGIEVRTHQAKSQQLVVKDSRSLVARVNSELKAQAITPSAIRPEGQSRLNLVIEGAPFSKLLAGLDVLQSQYGISVSQATIEPVSGTTGMVNARMTLAR